MSTRLFRILTALCGILGVGLLIPSFIINPGPPPDPTITQLIAFSNQYHNSILIGAWLQAVSPFLIVLFALAIVHQAGATTRLVGRMTIVGGSILIMTSLVEVTFYLSAVNGNPATTGLISLDLIYAVQHLYSMVAAPALFLPLAIVILSSRVLPTVFGYLALALGAAFVIAGIINLFSPIQHIVNDLSIVQGFWWLFAAITLLARVGKAFDKQPSMEREALTDTRTVS